MKIEMVKVGFIETNCYVVTDEEMGEIFIVDPGFEANKILKQINNKYKVKYILLTHAHYDHIGAVNAIKEKTGALVVCSKIASKTLNDPQTNLSFKHLFTNLTKINTDILIDDGASLTFGNDKITAMYTPGHTTADCSYFYKNNIFSGDFIFKKTIGRVDFFNSNYELMLKSLKKLSLIDGDYNIYPGHDENTTLSFELKNNPYLKQVL